MIGYNSGWGQNPYQAQPTYMNLFAWIQGEAAAKAYPVAPGNTVLLMDTENPILYMKSTDLNGRPQPMQTRYLVTEDEFRTLQNQEKTVVETQTYVTKEEMQSAIEDALRKVNQRKDKANGKSTV